MTQQELQKERPDILFCETKHRLIGDFIAANHELMELQNQQTRAIIDYDPDFSRFEDLIHVARQRTARTWATEGVSEEIPAGPTLLNWIVHC